MKGKKRGRRPRINFNVGEEEKVKKRNRAEQEGGEGGDAWAWKDGG